MKTAITSWRAKEEHNANSTRTCPKQDLSEQRDEAAHKQAHLSVPPHEPARHRVLPIQHLLVDTSGGEIGSGDEQERDAANAEAEVTSHALCRSVPVKEIPDAAPENDCELSKQKQRSVQEVEDM